MKTFDAATIRAALRLRLRGLSYASIQEITGVGRSTVIKYARLAGHPKLKSGMRPIFDARTRALACRLYAAGWSMPRISARTGASRDMIRRWAKAAGLEMRSMSWRARKSR